MNKEKVQAAMDDLKVKQDLFLISKLEEEYNELSDKCNKLYTYIYSLDFKEKVPDSNEQCLLQEQHKRMEAYRTNLYQRIEHYRLKVKIALGCDYFLPWSDVAKQLQKNGILLSPQEATQKLFNLFFKAKNMVYSPSEKCAKCGGDLLYGIGAKDGDETICFNCANQITNEELQQALVEYRAACTHHCGLDVRVQYDPNESQPVNVPVQGDDCDDACCQARAGRVDHDAALAGLGRGESLQQLVGYQVIAVCKPGSKCNGCPYEHYNAPCVKVEIVGGFFLCMEPLPNSIVTE